MESDSALHGELPDGAEMSPLEENLPDLGETSDNNVPANDSEAVSVEETGVKWDFILDFIVKLTFYCFPVRHLICINQGVLLIFYFNFHYIYIIFLIKTATNGAPTSSSDVLDVEPGLQQADGEEHLSEHGKNTCTCILSYNTYALLVINQIMTYKHFKYIQVTIANI